MNQTNARLACLIYTFSLSFSSSFAFQTDKITSRYICNSNDKWNDILNDWMLSVQMLHISLYLKRDRYKRYLSFSVTHNGPSFLLRFRLYVLSFMFRFMFVNICFEKNQNIKIHVMFITKHNMKWNRDLQFLGCLGSQGSREKSSFNLCKLCYVKHKHKS